MRVLLFTFTLLLSLSNIHGQTTSDVLKTYRAQEGNFYFEYKVGEGETAYQLSQKYGVNITDIQSANHEIDLSTLSHDQILRFPLKKQNLNQKQSPNSIAVIYAAQPKETLYTIAKRYFNQEVDIIKNINNLPSYDLSIGQELIVGFVNIQKFSQEPTVQSHDEEIKKEPIEIKPKTSNQEPVHTETTEIKSNVNTKVEMDDLIDMIAQDETVNNNDQDSIDVSITQQVEEIVKTLEKGMAYTENVPIESDDLFVLHPTAKVNSKMEISYPMLNTTAMATVISELPKELYPSNVSVVISPKVANALGAKDNQFRVEMKYIEE